MKYVVVRCEDLAPGGDQLPSLLEGAKMAHLRQLAQAGAGGTCRVERRSPAGWIDRFHVHRMLLGLEPRDASPPAGRCYAESIEKLPQEGEVVWSCDFITQRQGTIVDPTAGRITTKESALLIKALQSELGSDVRRWQLGEGSHHLLFTNTQDLDSASGQDVPPTELVVGEPLDSRLPKGAAGQTLNLLLERARTILEVHPVNSVRVDLGENPANGIWLWGPSGAAMHRTFADRTGLSGAVVSSSFLVRGLARSLNLPWYTGPTSWEERSLEATARSVTQLMSGRDFVYVHLTVDTADPVERLCAMDRLDQVLLRSCTDMLPREGAWRLLVAVDDRAQGSVPFVAAGTSVPPHPTLSLERAAFAGSPLSFVDGSGWFNWLTAAP